MKGILVWKMINKSLEQQVPVMLLYVLESKGSSPGRQGFFMAVNARGDMEGSIGGGIMEHKFVETVKNKLAEDLFRQASGDHGSSGPGAGELRKQIHDKSVAKNQSGMICSGEQTILLYKVQPSDKNTIALIILSLEESKNGTLILLPSGIQFESTPPSNDFEFAMQSENDWLYREKTGHKNILTIIGGGHCSLALSKLMRQMDFYIRVYDDRAGLKTMQENDAAHEKHFINSYTDLSSLVSSGNNHYVLIMTLGYRSDDLALRALIDKDFRFLGMLGSKTKVEKMFSGYRKENMKEEWLQRIHTPAGLLINSHSPEEIAVSIAAEIIGVKNSL